MNDAQKLVRKIVAAAEERKAQNTIVLDLRGVSLIADFFMICSAGSSIRAQAIAQHIKEKLEEEGVPLLRQEGYQEARWILLDYGWVVIHIFQEEERQFYNLERLWGDARPFPL